MNAEISALIDRLATSFARRFQSNAYDVDDLRSVAWLTVYRLRSERETEPSLSLLRSAIWRDTSTSLVAKAADEPSRSATTKFNRLSERPVDEKSSPRLRCFRDARFAPTLADGRARAGRSTFRKQSTRKEKQQ